MKRGSFVTPVFMVLGLLTTLPCNSQTSPVQPPEHPETLKSILDHKTAKLVVVMSFDQFRGDYLFRFSDQLLPAVKEDGTPGGFRWLMEKGALMRDAHYNHLPTYTGPGHATILTGASPARSGITGNSIRTSAGLALNCVGDSLAKTVGGVSKAIKPGSSSPANLKAETVGDALRMSNNRQSKVVGISIKDRGSILLSGRNPSAVVWYENGRFVSSTWYGDKLPDFAEKVNKEKIVDRWFDQQWTYLLPESEYRRSAPENPPGANDSRKLGASFPKSISGDAKKPNSDYYTNLIFTPFANSLIFEAGKAAIETEKLGTGATPDMLCMSFSTMDLIGHMWGPHSREAHDNFLRTDRYLSDFLNYIDKNHPGGLEESLIVITGDHGVNPVTEWSKESMKWDSQRIPTNRVKKAAEDVLRTMAPDKLSTGAIVDYYEPYIFFRSPVWQSGINLTEARQKIADEIAKIPGIYATFTRDQIISGNLPRTELATMATNGFNAERSGEIVIVCEQFNLVSGGSAGASHSSGYNYDTHVGLLFAGKFIKPGFYTHKVDIRDIAPTLSALLGITPPASAQGRILSEIIK